MTAASAAAAARDAMPSWWQKAAKASTTGAPPVLPRAESAMSAAVSDEAARKGNKNFSDTKSQQFAKKASLGRTSSGGRHARPKSAGLSATAAARKAVAAAYVASRKTAVAAAAPAEAVAQEAITDAVVADAILPREEQEPPEPPLTWAAPRLPREKRQQPTEEDADSASRVVTGRRFKQGFWPVSAVCPLEVRNLRTVSISRGHGCLASEYSATLRADVRATKATGSPLDIIDFQGGNGRWRQRKAEVEFEQRRAEEDVRQQEEDARREEKRRAQAELEARRRQHQQDIEQRMQEERLRRLREEAEEEQRRMKEAEQERLRREAEEQERLARQPRACETCGGDGLCKVCNGEGFIFTLFLSAHVNSKSKMKYGRVRQGCEACGGVSKHGVSDHVTFGSGKCVTCKGEGKLFPVQSPSENISFRSRGGLSPRAVY